MSLSESILVSDDDEVFRKRLARAFRDRGFAVAEAADSSSACSYACNNKVHMVVLDLKLAKESGLDLLQELRAINPESKIVVLTGYGTIVTSVSALKLGAVNYLTKPVDADTVLAAFERHSPSTSVETPQLDQVEWDHIQRVMNDCSGNVTKASKLLGLHRRSLQRKLAKQPQRLK